MPHHEDYATFEIAGNVFDDVHTDGDLADARTVAVAAWEQVKHWVHTGYQPVITVITAEGERVDVDLEEPKEAP